MEYYKQESHSNIKWIVMLVLAGLFAVDLWAAVSGISQSFDIDILQFAYGIRDDFLTIIFRFITQGGDTLVIAVICVVLVILPTRVRFGIPAACAAVIAGITHYVIKHLVERARPDESMWLIPEDGFSFPSGHANASFVFYLFLMILLRRYLILGKSYSAANLVSIVFPLLVAFIGGSRIYLGVHYPTDIIGGWLLGCVLLIIIMALYDNFYPAKNRITFDAPTWEYLRRRKPWRKPQVNHPLDERIEFPKNRSVWKRPGSTAKRRAVEEERQRRSTPGGKFEE
ncbi:MAG: phosphatase PAP2 family protein [Clostridiales Family XIII bacterium]|jgi:undecaprenyl-diphosphatase|nr:phosphatase PAP2 family protein [Clostridiales Family XIII bacterium]